MGYNILHGQQLHPKTIKSRRSIPRNRPQPQRDPNKCTVCTELRPGNVTRVQNEADDKKDLLPLDNQTEVPTDKESC